MSAEKKFVSEMALFSLAQKVFIVKSYYKCGESVTNVMKCLQQRYGMKINQDNMRSIAQIVLGFERTGSILSRYYYNGVVEETPARKTEPLVPKKSPAVPSNRTPLRTGQMVSPEPDSNVIIETLTEGMSEEDIIVVEMIDDDNVEVMTEYTETCEEEVVAPPPVKPAAATVSARRIAQANTKNIRSPLVTDSTEDGDSLCPKCGITVPKTKFPAHLRKHREENKIFQCEVCSVVFLTKELLFVHMREHRPRIICEFCGKVSRTRQTHKAHMLVHSDDKPYQCTLCPKKFVRPEGLRRHKLHHEGAKPYSCEHCHAKFSAYMGWQMHVRLHTGERPYECNHCDKRFIGRPALNTHLKTHVEEYRHVCYVCNHRYKTEKTLKDHIELKHQDVLDKEMEEPDPEEVVETYVKVEDGLMLI